MMKISLLCSVLVISALAAPATANDTAAKSQILKIETAMALAQNAEQSVTDYDPQITVYDMNGNSLIGRATVRDAFAKAFSGMRDLKVEILTMTIESSSTIGFANSTQRATAMTVSGGHPIDIVFRQTDCLHKVGGKWLVINQHISVPFDPTNGRAVFNSH